MGSITGGVIKYGRTMKTGDYENKRADAEISFTVPEGADAEPHIKSASLAAHEHVHRMLGLKADTPSAGADGSAAVPKRGPGGKKTATVAGSAPVSLAPAVAPSAPVSPALQAKTGASAAEIEDADFPGTQPAEINDKELQAECQKAASRLKGNQQIRVLRDKYLAAAGITDLPQVVLIPQASRVAFVMELDTLKA